MGIFNFFKKKFIVNFNSSEIHRISTLTRNCHVQGMTNKKKVRNAKKYFDMGFDGCRWCYPEMNDDE